MKPYIDDGFSEGHIVIDLQKDNALTERHIVLNIKDITIDASQGENLLSKLQFVTTA